MAIKGLSKPVCANYTAEGNTVTYSDVYAADKAVEYSFEADVAEDKDLYADNQVAETAAGRFVSGKLTLKTADLPPELSKKILGLKTATRQVGEETVTEVIYDDDQAAPYLGFGIIEEHQIDNKTGYLIDCSDPDVLAAQIIYCYNNRDEIREKAICGKQKCATEFFDSVMARNVASLYREMLGDI